MNDYCVQVTYRWLLESGGFWGKFIWAFMQMFSCVVRGGSVSLKSNRFILSCTKGFFRAVLSVESMQVFCPLWHPSHVHIVAFNARIDEQGPHSKISPLKSRAYFSEGFRFAVIGRFSNGRARRTLLILLQFDHICGLELREPLSSDVPDLLLTHSRLGSWSYLFSWTNKPPWSHVEMTHRVRLVVH